MAALSATYRSNRLDALEGSAQNDSVISSRTSAGKVSSFDNSALKAAMKSRNVASAPPGLARVADAGCDDTGHQGRAIGDDRLHRRTYGSAIARRHASMPLRRILPNRFRRPARTRQWAGKSISTAAARRLDHCRIPASLTSAIAANNSLLAKDLSRWVFEGLTAGASAQLQQVSDPDPRNGGRPHPARALEFVDTPRRASGESIRQPKRFIPITVLWRKPRKLAKSSIPISCS